jgi:hypothetical protein
MWYDRISTNLDMNDVTSHDDDVSLFAKESRSGRPNYTCCLYVQYGTELDKVDVSSGRNRVSSPLDFNSMWCGYYVPNFGKKGFPPFLDRRGGCVVKEWA